MIRKGLIWSAIGLAAMLAIILWVNSALPSGNKIPVHFDASGNPDRWGSKSEAIMGLWVILGTTVFTVILLAGLPKLMPRKSNFEKSQKAYFACWMGVLILMVGVTGLVGWTMVKGATSGSVGELPIKIILLAMAGLYVLIGNYLPKTRSNWVIGVRTPWTLSSDQSWEKTHRLSGILFLVMGLATALATFLLPIEIALVVSIGGILLVTGFSIFYSWWTWRASDDRKDGSNFVD